MFDAEHTGAIIRLDNRIAEMQSDLQNFPVLLTYSGNPDTLLNARESSLCWDTANQDIYVNVSSVEGTSWALLGGGGGGGSAPANAEYLVLSLNGSLSQERKLVVAGGATTLDGGANGNYTITVHDEVTLASAQVQAVFDLSAAQALDFDTQVANTIFAGPGSGVAAKPAFRALVEDDIPALPAYTFQKTGWDSDATSKITMSFNNGTRTFTITYSGAVSYWIDGTEYPQAVGTDTVTITDTEGLWFIYYDGATLTASQTPWDILAADKAFVAFLYWNATDNVYVGMGVELHGWGMDPQTHNHLHFTLGTLYDDGLTASISGSNINVTAGIIHDEDVVIEITDSAGAGMWEQDLTPLDASVIYLDGSSRARAYASSTAPVALSGTNVLWNNSGVPTAAGSNQYTAMWLVASNEHDSPLFWLMGTGSPANNVAGAVSNNGIESITWGDLPFPEFKILFRLIVRNTGASPYYTLSQLDDFRSETPIGSTHTPTEHGTLSGLGDDDHTQYLLIDGTRAMTGDLDMGSNDINNAGLIVMGTGYSPSGWLNLQAFSQTNRAIDVSFSSDKSILHYENLITQGSAIAFAEWSGSVARTADVANDYGFIHDIEYDTNNGVTSEYVAWLDRFTLSSGFSPTVSRWIGNQIELKDSGAGAGAASITNDAILLYLKEMPTSIVGGYPYAIYQEGENDFNQFNGQVGIGEITSPLAWLEVYRSTATATPMFFAFHNYTGDSYPGWTSNIQMAGTWMQTTGHQWTTQYANTANLFGAISWLNQSVMTNAYGASSISHQINRIQLGAGYTGNISSVYLMQLDASFGVASGTIGQIYGLYIPTNFSADTTGQSFGVYQAGADDYNYYAGRVGLGIYAPVSPFHVISEGASVVVATIDLASGQTANAIEIRNSTPTVLTAFDENGYLHLGGSNPTAVLDIDAPSASAVAALDVSITGTASTLVNMYAEHTGGGICYNFDVRFTHTADASNIYGRLMGARYNCSYDITGSYIIDRHWYQFASGISATLNRFYGMDLQVQDLGVTSMALTNQSAVLYVREIEVAFTGATCYAIWQDGASDLVRFDGDVGIGGISATCKLDVNDDHIRVRSSQTPASAGASGNAGDIAWDSSYVYVCVAANTWKRVAISTW